MHFSNLVIINPDRSIEEAVKLAMGVHEDHGGFWDWYQIGGRWTGVLDGYEPEKDPANIIECDLCSGTGTRNVPVPSVMSWVPTPGECNGCNGKGQRAVWPTNWIRHAGDVAPVESLTQEQYDKFYRVVDGPRMKTYGGEEYLPWRNGGCFIKRERPPLEWLKREYRGHLVVVVDNHS